MGDKKQLKWIYEHFINTVDEDEFVDMYKYATSRPFGFFYIETDPDKETTRFRSGFNKYISLKKKECNIKWEMGIIIKRGSSEWCEECIVQRSTSGNMEKQEVSHSFTKYYSGTGDSRFIIVISISDVL